MRLISLLILLVIGISAIATGSSFEQVAGTGTLSFQTLDVCHSATPVLNPDLPYISACPCAPMPVLVTTVAKLPQTALNAFILAFQDERPPEA